MFSEQAVKHEALFDVTLSGDVMAVRLLLKKGASVEAVNEYGDTILMYAARLNNGSIARLLLEAGADHTKTNSQGETAEQLFARHGVNMTDLFNFSKGMKL